MILMYHRICEVGFDPWAITVRQKHFEEQLATLRRHRRIISLRQLVAELEQGELGTPSAAITFDDGYADNLLLAKPLLERYEAPATVFVATGAIDRQTEFYWDELDRIFLQPGRLPPSLQLDIDGISRRWELNGAATYREEDAAAHRGWRAWHRLPSERQGLFLELWRLLQPMQEEPRQEVLARLRAWAGIPTAIRAERRTLTGKELAELAAGSLVEIGAHSITHATLPAQSAPMVEREVRQSKLILEEWLGRAVTSFAYPYGDHDIASIAAVHRAGFDCACTTREDTVHPGADRFQLPRIHVMDWDGREFERRLAARFVR